jgi:channel protein (hemolysin III family)
VGVPRVAGRRRQPEIRGRVDRARLATAIYALSVAALFRTSALYHRVDWRTLGPRRWMRWRDHTMIFVLIAGSYTPFGPLVLHGTLGAVILIAAWSAALAGATFKLFCLDALGGLIADTYTRPAGSPFSRSRARGPAR